MKQQKIHGQHPAIHIHQTGKEIQEIWEGKEYMAVVAVEEEGSTKLR
jgi:hypothetical protein